ncbi:MAG: DNA repair protein RecO [Halieaceae bacterium]
MRVSLQPAYLLHRRPYRDSSQLLEVFTAEHGRLSLVAKGVRRKTRGGSTAAIVQAFVPLLLSFSGRADLKTLTAAEVAGGAFTLRGERLFSGLYLNELLLRLLPRYDPHPQLFASYASTLQALAASDHAEETLRRFEFGLLDELGYSFDLTQEAVTGAAISEEGWYSYQADSGLITAVRGHNAEVPAFAGADLLALSRDEYTGDTRRTAKRLLRQVLSEHLDGQPLRSRDLFSQFRQSGRVEGQSS